MFRIKPFDEILGGSPFKKDIPDTSQAWIGIVAVMENSQANQCISIPFNIDIFKPDILQDGLARMVGPEYRVFTFLIDYLTAATDSESGFSKMAPVKPTATVLQKFLRFVFMMIIICLEKYAELRKVLFIFHT